MVDLINDEEGVNPRVGIRRICSIMALKDIVLFCFIIRTMIDCSRIDRSEMMNEDKESLSLLSRGILGIAKESLIILFECLFA